MKGDKEIKKLQPITTGMPTVSQPLQPIISITEADSMSDPVKGEVLVVKIGANGQEIKNSAFYIGEATFNRTFANNPAFKIKKKASQE